MLRAHTNSQAASQQDHIHMGACHKPPNGDDGCRLAFGQSECNGTHPVFLCLQAKNVQATNEENDSLTSSESSKTDSDSDLESESSTDSGVIHVLRKSGAFSYTVQDPVPEDPEQLVYHTCPVLKKNLKESAIVWETDWPQLEAILVASSFDENGKLVNWDSMQRVCVHPYVQMNPYAILSFLHLENGWNNLTTKSFVALLSDLIE